MSPHNLGQALLQSWHVWSSLNFKCDGNVVQRTAGRQLLKEPQALLRERKRAFTVASTGAQWYRFGWSIVSQCRVNSRSEAGDGRRVEQVIKRHFNFECVPESRND